MSVGRVGAAAFTALWAAWTLSACAECERGIDCPVQHRCLEGVCDPIPPPPDGLGNTVPEPTQAGATGDACGDAGCESGLECVGGFCVGSGLQRISMVFDGDTDMDLHVVFPNNGGEIYYGNRTVGVGTLDVDQCVGTCGPGPHVENVFFTAAPPSGEYIIRAVNFGSGRAASNVQLQVAGIVNTAFSGSVTDEGGNTFEQRVTF